MLRTDTVIKLLKNNKETMSFEDIWNSVKDETIASISKEQDEIAIKSDLYMSMMEDQTLLMVGDNTWGLKETFSYEEIEQIKKSRVTDDIETDLEEETDDTRELKLGIATTGEEE